MSIRTIREENPRALRGLGLVLVLCAFLTGGTMLALWPSGARSAAQVASGTYTGNAVDDRAISGLGFQPDVVIVGTEASNATIVRTSTMPGDASKPLGDTGAPQPNLVQSLDGNGFTIGSDARVNGSAITYHWVAMQAGSGLAVGSYTGNNSANRSITGIGFQPTWVMTLADGSDSLFRPASVSTGGSFRIAGFTQVLNRIKATQADGFVVGGDPEVNLTGRTYYYIAWGAGSDTVQGTYAGNGVDNRSIDIGLQPAFLWIKRDDGSQSAWRSASVAGDQTLTLDATAPGPNRIQALQSNGFQVGANAIVNSSGKTYHYLAIGSAGAPLPTPTPTATPSPTSTPLPGSVEIPVFSNETAPAGIQGGEPARPYSWGVAWADYNNDFWPDAFYGRHAGLKSSLYSNQGDGTFEDIAPAAGIQKKLDRHGCTWADYDADGFIDLMCTGGFPGPRTIVLYHNNSGNGTFTDLAVQAGLTKTDIPSTLAGRATTWADFDGDGWLDFFHNGEFKQNVLARNLGGSTFSNIAVQPLLNFANTMMESDSSVDYDNDNRWDVFNCSVRQPRDEVQRSWLYRNTGNNTWQSMAVPAGIIVDSCHSASWGDYDNDGYMDLFIGGRITPYTNIESEVPETIIPNRLYRNLGTGTFQDVTAAAGILPTQAHMGLWGDFNNDGWQDLYVVNAVGLNDPPQPHKLYINNQDGTFSEVANLAGVSDNGGGSGDGAAWADYNRDGALDILLGNGGGIVNCDSTPNCKGPPRLFRNTLNGNHWLQIHLRATGNPFGYGSKVQLTSNGLTQYRQVTDGVSGMSQNYQMVQFGLGDETSADAIVIRWPDGTQTTLNDVQADQELLVTEGGGVQVLTH